MSVLPVSQNKRRALFRNLLVGLIALLGVLTFASRMFEVDVQTVATVLLVPILVLAMLQLSVLDEAAKQAHFAAWYWGCTVAIVAIGAIAISVTQGAVPFEPIAAFAAKWLGSADQADIFAAGLVTSLALMIAGYLVFSIIYWLRTR